jgi:hypothetical protein
VLLNLYIVSKVLYLCVTILYKHFLAVESTSSVNTPSSGSWGLGDKEQSFSDEFEIDRIKIEDVSYICRDGVSNCCVGLSIENISMLVPNDLMASPHRSNAWPMFSVSLKLRIKALWIEGKSIEST